MAMKRILLLIVVRAPQFVIKPWENWLNFRGADGSAIHHYGEKDVHLKSVFGFWPVKSGTN